MDGNIYRNVTKTDDGYTCTVEDKNGVKTTYTFTKQAGAPLTPEEIQTALAGQYSVSADSIRLNADGKTATFTKGDETITVDYSTLSETLTVRKDVHTSSSVTGIIKDDKDLEKAYDELWKQIQEIQSKLQPGEELRIGETKIDSTTKKEDIIKYFTKAISPDDMSKDELIKALQEQERIAKSSTYVANKGSDYEETRRTITPVKRRMNSNTSARHRMIPKLRSIGNGLGGAAIITIQTLTARKFVLIVTLCTPKSSATTSATSTSLPAPSWICCRMRTARSTRPTACW